MVQLLLAKADAYIQIFTRNVGSGQLWKVQNEKFRAMQLIIVSMVLSSVIAAIEWWPYSTRQKIDGQGQFIIAICVLTTFVVIPQSVKYTQSANMGSIMLAFVSLVYNYYGVVINPRQSQFNAGLLWMLIPTIFQLTWNFKITFFIFVLTYSLQIAEMDIMIRYLADESVRGIEGVQRIEMFDEDKTNLLLFDLIGFVIVWVYAINRKQMEQMMKIHIKQTKIADKTKDMFLKSMTEEFKRPLATILNGVETIKSQKSSGIQDTGTLEKITNCGQILMHKINDGLNISRLQEGELWIDIEECDIRRIILTLIQCNKNLALRKGLSISFKSDVRLPSTIFTDRSRVSQVLMNLISNAIKFTKEGYIKILVFYTPNIDSIPREDRNLQPMRQELDRGVVNEIKLESYNYTEDDESDEEDSEISEVSEESEFEEDEESQHLIDVIQVDQDSSQNVAVQTIETRPEAKLDQKKDYCRYRHETEGFIHIDVVDTGCGISKEFKQSIFTPYAQETQEVSDHHGGKGLGLWLSKQIMTSLNGQIKVQSDKGSGSTFTITFPVKVKQAPSAQEIQSRCPWFVQAVPVQAPAESRVILTALNSEICESSIPDLLRSWNWKVKQFTNGIDLVEYYMDHDERVYGVIAELTQPDISGIEIAEQIKEYEKQSYLLDKPMVLVDSQASMASKKQAFNVGATEFLLVPFDQNQLRKALYAPTPAGYTILNVVANDVVAEISRQNLRILGHSSKFVETWDEALSTVNNTEDQIHLVMVFLDTIDQETKKVWESVTQMKNWQAKNDMPLIPVIVCVSEGEEIPMIQSQAYSVDLELQIPTSTKNLKDAISRLVTN